MNDKDTSEISDLNGLLQPLRNLIQQARSQVLRAVDIAQVNTYWEIGRHIVEFEQRGSTRAKTLFSVTAREA